MAPPIDIVFLPGSSDPDFGLDALQVALREQGVEPASTTTIQDADPLVIRVTLAAALDSPDGTGRAIALLDAGVLVNAPALGAVLDDPRVRTGALSVSQAGTQLQLQLGVLRVDVHTTGDDELRLAAVEEQGIEVWRKVVGVVRQNRDEDS